MKKVIPTTLLALLCAAGVVLAAGDRSKTFKVTADTIEGCSCPLFCGCYFNGEPNDPHMCQFNNVYRFDKGSHYGDTDLSGVKVWMSGDLGGEWGKDAKMPTEWVTITFDKSATPAQRDGVKAVFAKVFPVQWKKVAVREDEIEWNDAGPKKSAHMKSGKGDIELAMWKGAKATEPTVLKNVQYWGTASNEGFVLAKSTHHFDGDVKFSEKDKNGFTIRWTLEGTIEPPAAHGH
jgi:hypothetical protein